MPEHKALSPKREGWSAFLTNKLGDVIILVWKMTTEEARQLTNRYLVHGVVLVMALAALSLGSLPSWGDGALASPAETESPSFGNSLSALASAPISETIPVAIGGPIARNAFHTSSDIQVLYRQAQPYTEIPQRLRLEFITYTVQPGDTTQGIALTFGVEDTTIMWCNPEIEDMPDYLKIDQEVVIPPIDGACHMVKEGDTLESIAKKYKVETTAITNVSFNNLQGPDYKIGPDMRLIVEGGQKPYVPKIVTAYTGPVPEGARGTGLFQWPAVGTLTQGYWFGHRAIDIAAYTGSPIVAADGGFVAYAGWSNVGYGYLIVIDHANGFSSYYAHCSGFYVSVGQAVERGQLIATMGSTGNSTGPHLHFEIRSNGMPLNPRGYLP